MNKFIEREKEIEKTVEEYKKHIQWNLSIELLEDAVKCLTEEKNNICRDLETAEENINELEYRLDGMEEDQIKYERRLNDIEEECNSDLNDLLPHGETFDDIVFQDDIEDQINDTLDDILEDKVKEIFENDIKDKISEVFAGSEIEFNQEVMNGIMRGIARKIYNLIASV